MAQLYFSASTQGFYHSDIHKQMPGDVVPISKAEHDALLAAQSEGAQIIAGADGKPVAQARAEPALADRRRAKVDGIKQEAERRIEQVAPIWRQLNALRDDPASFDWSMIDAIRAASDALEQFVDAADEASLSTLNIGGDAHWPSPAN